MYGTVVLIHKYSTNQKSLFNVENEKVEDWGLFFFRSFLVYCRKIWMESDMAIAVIIISHII